MKLTFFLIAVFLIVLRLSLPALGLWHNGNSNGTIVMTGDNYREELKWSGKFRLSDDERSIAEMTPGGYLTFRENDTALKAESNMQGEIGYTLSDGSKTISPNDPAAAPFIAAQIQKMIQVGFFADGRPGRILRKGGNRALLAEYSRFRIEGAGQPYLDLLLKSDSLTTAERIDLLHLVGQNGNFAEMQSILSRFSPDQLQDSATSQNWLAAVDRMKNEQSEKDVLVNYLKNDTVNRAGLDAAMYDSVVSLAGRWGSVFEKRDVYRCLATIPGKNDDQWIVLTRACGSINDDQLKGDLLRQIWQAGPKTDSFKAEYISAAKTIRDDWQYGKTMRAIN